MLDPSRAIARLLKEDKRYKFDAYVFVFEALNFAQDELQLGTETTSEPSEVSGVEEEESGSVERHVSGQQLCEAIRQYALRQYGYMAKTVLNSWGVLATGDFGEIVFNLIRIGQMRKTKEDRREDFDDVYDFETAFLGEFKITPSE
ncbi:MAG: Minf_1886 family protein [Planctomycetota bacterium]